MHTSSTALETLRFLQNNYLVLAERIDLEMMPSEVLDGVQNAPVRPFRIGSWVARQGCFISVWALWEYYSRRLCECLVNKEKKSRGEPTVEWIGRSLAANNILFRNQRWFEGANGLRNLIVHYGARVDCARGESLLGQCRAAFPDIDLWKDGYVNLTHSHLGELHINIEDLIRETRPQASSNGDLCSIGFVERPKNR
jgi:hypothetical protein